MFRRRHFTKKQLCAISAAAFGATYWYVKPAPAPMIPYVPPPFVWTSIPTPILSRFTLPDPVHDGCLWNALSTVVVGTTGTLSKLFLKTSQTTVHNLSSFLNILNDPQRTQGIITVSNHESVLDDPVLWGVLPLPTLWNIHRMRWVLGAADICYTSIFKSYFFVFGQTIPTMRGGGIYQPGVDFAIHKLNEGGWIHIYPESKVVQQNKMIRFKWGIGRILMDTQKDVIVVPIWHKGMHLAKPLYGSIHTGQPITLVFGKEPVKYKDIVEEYKTGNLTKEEARIQITQRMYDAVDALRKEYDE